MKYFPLVTLTAIAPMTLALLGCSSASSTPPATQPSTSSTEYTNHDHGGHEHHSDSSHADMEKMKASLAKLSAEDAESAEKQHICPVSGEMLGTMGLPEKVTVNGQQVWICCDGCKDQLLESPNQYLAKLKKD